MIKVSTETTARMTTRSGQLIRAWHTDAEPNEISLAVPADRAKMTPAEARELAQWLNAKADSLEPRTAPAGRYEAYSRAREADSILFERYSGTGR